MPQNFVKKGKKKKKRVPYFFLNEKVSNIKHFLSVFAVAGT